VPARPSSTRSSSTGSSSTTTPATPGANINYQSIGSGGGIRQFLEQTVDFGASERYLRAEQLQAARRDRGCDAIQFPIVFGSVTIAFNDAFYDELILDGNTIADIFERRITKYNDPAIQALNPGRELRDEDIIPVHRSDGSGTTSVFTTYLDKDLSISEGKWTLATALRSSGRPAPSAARATKVSVQPSSRTRVRSAT
jgi:ABC-type phosphate transport system substrate-binding protein